MKKIKNEHLENTKGVKTVSKVEAKKSTKGLFDFLDGFALFDFLKLAEKVLITLGKWLTSPVGLALIGITSFVALSAFLSGYIADWIKNNMPDYSKPKQNEAENALINGSNYDKIKTANSLLPRGIVVKDAKEAEAILRKYIDTGKVDPDAGKKQEIVTPKKGITPGTASQTSRFNKNLEVNPANKDQNDRRIESLTTPVRQEDTEFRGGVPEQKFPEIPRPNYNQFDADKLPIPGLKPISDTSKGDRLQSESNTNNDLQQKMSSSQSSLINSPVTNIINNSGGDVLFEQLTGVRTGDMTLKKIQMCNYRWV